MSISMKLRGAMRCSRSLDIWTGGPSVVNRTHRCAESVERSRARQRAEHERRVKTIDTNQHDLIQTDLRLADDQAANC